MTEEKKARISELTRISRERELTEEETRERAALRRNTSPSGAWARGRCWRTPISSMKRATRGS